jgi:hypothetical protein
MVQQFGPAAVTTGDAPVSPKARTIRSATDAWRTAWANARKYERRVTFAELQLGDEEQETYWLMGLDCGHAVPGIPDADLIDKYPCPQCERGGELSAGSPVMGPDGLPFA